MKEPLGRSWAVFNASKEEFARAKAGFVRRYDQNTWDKEIKNYENAGIMSIFHAEPNEHTLWYVEILSFIVNERICE